MMNVPMNGDFPEFKECGKIYVVNLLSIK